MNVTYFCLYETINNGYIDTSVESGDIGYSETVSHSHSHIWIYTYSIYAKLGFIKVVNCEISSGHCQYRAARPPVARQFSASKIQAKSPGQYRSRNTPVSRQYHTPVLQCAAKPPVARQYQYHASSTPIKFKLKLLGQYRASST